jgi:hypothetical protein
MKGLCDAAELRERPPEPGGVPAALQYAHQLGRADGSGGQRARDAEDVFPLLDDQLDVDAVRSPHPRNLQGSLFYVIEPLSPSPDPPR